MAPKKAGVKMSMAELGEKFGGDIGANMLPTHSEGKDFGKSKGKGFRGDFDDRSEMHDWRSGKGEGKSRFGRDRNEGPSRSDQGDWLTKEPVRGGGGGGGGGGRDRDDRDRDGEKGGGGGGFRGGGGRGGFDRDRRGDDGEAEKDSDWRSGGRRTGGRDGGDDRDDGPRRGGGFGGRNRDDDAGGGWRRDRDTRGGDDAPSSRPRLNLLPRSKPVPDRDTAPDTDRNRDEDDDKSKTRSNPFGAAKRAPATPAKPATREDDSRRGVAPESRPVEPPWKAGKNRAPVAEETGTEDDAEDGGDGEWELPKKTAARGKKEVVPTKVVARPAPAAKDSDKSEDEDDDDEEEEEEQDKDEDEEDEEDEEEGKGKKIPPEKASSSAKGPGAKWVPPSLAKRQKAQEQERAKQEDEERKKEEEKRQREEERRQKAELENRRRKEDEDRKASVKATPRTAGGGGGGGYVPPAKRHDVDARRKKEEDEDRKAREAEEKKKQQEEQRREREKVAKLEAKERKEAEAKARKEASKQTKPGKPTSAQAPAVISEDRLSKFVGKCENLVDDDGDMEDAVDDAISVLTEAELQSIQPTRRLVALLMRHCRGKSEEWVVNFVERFSPLFDALIDKSELYRFKVQVLCEAQRAAHDMGLPRLSPSAALIEVFFDALYRAEIIEEQYFEWWALNDDETPGKTNAMFQINPFLDWLRTAPVEGEEREEEEEKEGDEDEDEEDEDEEYEIDPIGIKSRR